MNQLVSFVAHAFPSLIAAAGERAQLRFLEFFTANIRNAHTPRAYAQATREFLAWCEIAGVPSIAAVQPIHVAGHSLAVDNAGARAQASQRLDNQREAAGGRVAPTAVKHPPGPRPS